MNLGLILGGAYAAVLAIFGVFLYRLRRPAHPALPQRLTQARRRTGLDQTDPRWGTDTGLLDECSLLLPEFAPGTDRLLQAIHDDQKEGDQQ